MAKTVAIDFDGVIHKYSKGWQDGTIYDEPYEGWMESIKEMLDIGYNVFIFTSRSPQQIKGWFDRNHQSEAGFDMMVVPDDVQFWNKDSVGVTTRKLPADVYVDDRALLFDGDWDDTLKKIKDWEA